MRRDFDSSFVTQYQPAFTELVRLGSVAAQKKVNGRDALREDETANRLLITLQALNCDGLTAKETEALEYCLISLNESLAVPTVVAFAPSFITQYQAAFTELVRLGSIASQNKIDGTETGKEDEIAQRLFIVLQALDSGGLTAAQVDALEYCLLRLNESLVNPTVQALVNVSHSESPEDRTLRAWMGAYYMNGQDISITLTRAIEMGMGGFTYTGIDVGIFHNKGVYFDPGAFVLTGNSANLVYTEIDPYTFGLLLNEAVTGEQSWRAVFNYVTGTRQLDVTGNGDSASGTQKSTNDVTVTVWKTSNSGITQDNGTVEFELNGVNVDSQAFSPLDNLDGTGSNYKQYVFTGLVPGDELDVIITEG